MRNAGIALVVVLVGCSGDAKPSAPPTVTKRVLLGDKLDVLFVIDNSPFTDEQFVLAQNLPQLIAAFDAFPQGRPDLHIGIVTTTVDIGVQGVNGCPSPAPNDDGLLVNTPRVATACANGASPPTGRFFTDVKNPSGGRTTNYNGSLADALSCIAQVGGKGCDFEAPLEAMKRALDGSRTENAGFLRDDADLAVFLFTDEDDCSVADPALFSLTDVGPGDFRCQPLEAYDCDPEISATEPGTYTNCRVRRTGYLYDPQDYVKFLATVKDPSQTFVELVAGDPTTTITTTMITSPFPTDLRLEPSCDYNINGNPVIATSSLRLSDFQQAFGDHSEFQTICKSDYSSTLVSFGSGLSTMMSPCLDSGLATDDIDPNRAGLQLDCTVTDRDAANNIVGLPIPVCEMLGPVTPAPAAPEPCYWLEPNAASCSSSPTQLELHVLRNGAPDPTIEVTQVTCRAAP